MFERPSSPVRDFVNYHQYKTSNREPSSPCPGLSSDNDTFQIPKPEGGKILTSNWKNIQLEEEEEEV